MALQKSELCQATLNTQMQLSVDLQTHTIVYTVTSGFDERRIRQSV